MEADARFFADASTDRAIQRYSLHRPQPFTIAAAEEQLKNCETTWLTVDGFGRPTGSLVITDAETGAPLGQCGVDGWSDGDVAQIGYWLIPRARGRGIATRAVGELTGWLFKLGAQRIVLTVVEDNHDSMRVAQRSGFVFDGPTGEQETWSGRSRAVLRFALTEQDWKRRRTCR